MPSEAQKNAGYLLPDDVQSILDAELVPFCGLIPDTKYTRAALQGTIFELSKWWNWEKSFKSGDRRAANVAGYLLDILTDHFQIAKGCGVTLQLRQNELNPCLLEQSLDGGETWTTAFNYGLCTSGGESDILDAVYRLSDQVQEYQNTLNDYLNDPNYTPANITNNDDALCWTITQFVDFVCETVKEDRQRTGGEMQLGAVILGGIIGAVSVIIGVGTVGVGGIIAMGIAAALLGSAGTLWSAVSEALLNDDDAKNAVVCCMYDALSGTVPTRAALETSLDLCGFDPLSNEAQLAGAISASLAEDELQLAFFEMLSTAIDFAANLPAVDCTCITDWCYTWDFTTSAGGWSGFAPYLAAWTAGTGWVGTRASDPDQTYITLQFGTLVNVTSIEFTWAEVTTPNANSFVIDGESGSIALPRLRWETDGPYPVFGWTGDENLTGVSVGCERSGGTDTGSNAITSVTIKGTGTNPFGTDNCT